MDEADTIEALDRAERRRRLVLVVAVIVVVAAVVAYLFVPRTVASGEVDGDTWRLRIAPVAFGSEVMLSGAPDDVDRRQVARSGGLDETVVWHIGSPDAEDDQDGPAGATVVVGPTPDEVASVQVTSQDRVREARVMRIGWRRYHVHHIPGHVRVTELVAVDEVGRPIEVSELEDPSTDGG